MERQDELSLYLKEGLNIIPLRANTKIGEMGWPNARPTEEELRRHFGNFGWHVDYGYIAIDVDIKNKEKDGIASFKKFAKDCRIEEAVIKKMVAVGTPSGGFHLYIKLPQSYKRKMEEEEIKMPPNPKDDKGNEIYPGIDFQTRGKYVVIPPSKIDNNEYKFFQTEKIFNEPTYQMLNVIVGLFRIKNEKNYSKPKIIRDRKKEEELILKALEKIDPTNHDEYIKVGFALRNYYKESYYGFQLWDYWCYKTTRNNYNYEDNKSLWEGLDINHPKPITIASIFAMAKGLTRKINTITKKEVLEWRKPSPLWKNIIRYIKENKVKVSLGVFIMLLAIMSVAITSPTIDYFSQKKNTVPVEIPDTPSTTILNIQWTAIDGDTIKSSNRHNAHLYGIDAPELNQSCHTDNKEWPCGRQSKQELQILIENKKMVCQFKSKDRYGRSVEDCAVNGKSISEYMVENGWAVAYTRYSNKYKAAELKAKKNKLGIWSADCFIEPERWRRGDRCRN